MWAQIERFARASAKRADTIGDFLESFKRRMACNTINPKWMQTGIIHANTMINEDGEILQFNQPRRDFMVEIVEGPKEAQEAVLDVLYHNTQRVILLVRDRIEREKPIELQLERSSEADE
jgi:hypothetical protein